MNKGGKNLDYIERTARRLFENWNSKKPYEAMSGDFAIGSAAEGYEIQLALQMLHAPIRGPIVGRKIALAAKTMQEMVGFDAPIAGAIFANDVFSSPAKINLSDFVHLGLEFELAVELNSDIVPKLQKHTSQSVANLIAAVRPCFELIEDRNADYAKLDPYTILADNAWCGGIVLGDPLLNWRDLDLNNIPSTVYQEGVAPEDANTGAADPLGSLAWVLNHLGERGILVSKGEHVITGSAVRTRFPKSGDKLSYTMQGVAVEISIV